MLSKIAIVLATVALPSLGSSAPAEEPQMIITSAIANLATPATILIDGQQFRPGGLRDTAPQVFIGVPGGTLQPMEILNAFAYTCGFSVCAAKAGWQTTSLDLSKKYLEWGKRNFVGNGLNPSAHEFIHGDVFDWFGRLAKKQRQFNLILLDPPTFS